jgi:methionyl-tRNA synthetase
MGIGWSMPRTYLTTPIYYVNDKPHIGHAYTSLAADVLARWKRLQGHDVFFLTGTDEHGQKVEKAAQDAGEDPQAFTDRVSQSFRTLTAAMGFSNDAFIRTTEPRHRAACQALWQGLHDRGEIYLGGYEGWYAVRDEAFYGPDELVERDGARYARAARRWNGSRSQATSSGYPPGRTACSPSMRPIPTSSPRRAAATR